MSRRRVLTDEEIQEAKRLKAEMSYTKQRLAQHFEVSPTTIWENVFASRRQVRKLYTYRRSNPIIRYRHLPTFIMVINDMRREGYTSGHISEMFSVPLKEMNYIFTHNIISFSE